MSSFRIYKMVEADSNKTITTLTLPNGNVNNETPNIRQLVYNTTDATLYFANGLKWTPVSTGGPNP
jgi:hypothetical protein